MPCSTTVISLPSRAKALKIKESFLKGQEVEHAGKGFLPGFLWWKLFLSNEKQMRQNFNRKCTRGDEELPSQVTAQTDLKLEEDAVFFHRLILLRVWPQLSGKLPADKQRHSQSGKALGKNESGWGELHGTQSVSVRISEGRPETRGRKWFERGTWNLAHETISSGEDDEVKLCSRQQAKKPLEQPLWWISIMSSALHFNFLAIWFAFSSVCSGSPNTLLSA